MGINSKFEELKENGKLPSPKGVALRVIELIDIDATNQDIAYTIKADPALSSRIIKIANAKISYQTRPIASIADAVTILGFNTVRQLTLGLSLMDGNCNGACEQFDYQDFWAHSLLTAITAQNMILSSGIGSTEEVFILGLMVKIGSLSLASAHPQQYARILSAATNNPDSTLIQIERNEFGYDHNQLTQALLEDWGLPRLFQEVALHHEDLGQSNFQVDSRQWRLLHVMHISDLFSQVCLSKDSHQRKLLPKLMFVSSRLGIETDALANLCDKSVHEWHEWSKLCGIRSVEFTPFKKLLEAVPLASGMVNIGDEIPGDSVTFYKLRVLLIDDDRTILLLTRKLLDKAGHTVVTASNGVEGLGLIDKFQPQLIMTDWMMPEMDGIEFCKSLRQNPSWCNIYAFIMTAQEGIDRLVEAFEAGANDYITKPINPKVLIARLRAAQRVVQLQEGMENDRQQLKKFADELAVFNQRLRKSDVSMRAILENSPYMTWLKDINGHYINVNKAYVSYTHASNADELIMKTDFDLWPKDIAERNRTYDLEVIASGKQKRFEESSFEGNTVRWIETFRTPVIDLNGKVLGTTGFARDITDRKQTEAELRIAATAFETQEGMFVTDTNMTILRVNHAFTEITGFTAIEAIGKTPRLLKSGRHDKTFYEVMWKSIHDHGSWHGEILNRRKSGEIYPEQLTITAVKEPNNKITHFVASMRDITDRKKTEEQILKLAFHDTLTQLPNRRLLIERLGQTMANRRRSSRFGALIFLDLDNFKPLNDIHGHNVGDLLLIEVARRISQCVREEDTVARFGGDEFVVLLSELSMNKTESVTQASKVAEKIRSALADPYRLVLPQDINTGIAIEHQCTSSIGVALFFDHQTEQSDLLKFSDQAMYQAKQEGRNRVVISQESLSEAKASAL